MINANVIEWEVVGSEAKAKSATLVSATPPEGPDDRIKQRLLADWLQKQQDLAACVEKLGKGLITVEITGRTVVTPPAVDAAQSPELRLVEALRDLKRGP